MTEANVPIHARLRQLASDLTMMAEFTPDEVAILRDAADRLEQVDTVRAERDEARRMVCSLKAASVTQAFPREHFATIHGWDCFKENQ